MSNFDTFFPASSTTDTKVAINAADITNGNEDVLINKVSSLDGSVTLSVDGTGTDNRTLDLSVTSPGIVTWLVGSLYALNAIVELDGILYRSRVGGNIGNSPDTSPTQWANMTGIGLQTIATTAGGLVLPTTNPGTANPAEQLSNGRVLVSIDFSDTPQQFAQFIIPTMPESWDGGALQVIFKWEANSASTNTVQWRVSGLAFSEGDSTNVVSGATVANTTANGGIYIMNETVMPDLTLAGAAAGDMVQLDISRDGGTLTADARLEGVIVLYTTVSSTDNS